MPRSLLRAAFGGFVLSAGLLATAAPSAHAAAPMPGADDTFVIHVCPFPIQVHDAAKWYKEIDNPSGVQDHYAKVSIDFTNLVTGAAWHVAGNNVAHWVENPDGSLTQTVDGVTAAYGPLHTVYYGHWTRTFLDGIPGPVPFVGSGRTVDICERLS